MGRGSHALAWVPPDVKGLQLGSPFLFVTQPEFHSSTHQAQLFQKAMTHQILAPVLCRHMYPEIC